MPFTHVGPFTTARPTTRYTVALAAVTAATLIRFAAGAWLAEDPSVMFLAAVAVTVWAAGRGPGIAAVVLSALAQAHWFIAPEVAWLARPEQASMLAMWVVEGLLVCVLFGALDVARERAVQAAAALEESEDSHRLLFAANPLPMYTYDKESLRFVAVNDAALALFGYTRDEFLARTLSDLALSAGSDGPAAARTCDGTIVNVEVTAREIDLRGRRTVLCATADVTQRRHLEEQLRQSQKMEAVGRLAGGVAHDFNNMLSVIIGYTQIHLADMPPEDPIRPDIEEMDKAAGRAADLTRQLLMFSRQQVLQPKDLQLDEVLGGLKKMLHRLVGEDIEVLVRAEPGLDCVHADPSSIDQVVMNLVVNARDAMPKGGRLTLEVNNVVLDDAYAREHPGAKPGRYVMLSAADTGIGMDAATRTRIFEPFFTTKAEGKGTGLGLSTVFGIVAQSGGSMTVDSEPGKGTTFRLYLPAVAATDEPVLSARAPLSHGGHETILLVEDENQVRTVASGILRRRGYRVLQAKSGVEALTVFHENAAAIALVLTDVVMPGMSGVDLAAEVTRVRPSMRVMCMSGYTDDTVVRHGLTDSGLAFLQKPFTPQSLSRKVRAVIDGRA
jgi:signal transduction histidine kinase